MMLVLQWGGAALAVWGYWLFGRALVRRAALITMLAGWMLMMWAVLSGAWGIVALNLVVFMINARAWWRSR